MPRYNEIEITPEISNLVKKHKGVTLSEMSKIISLELGVNVSNWWITKKFPGFIDENCKHATRKRKNIETVKKFHKFEFTQDMDNFLIRSARKGTIPVIVKLFANKFGVNVGRDRIRVRYVELGIDLFSVEGYTRLTDIAVASGVTEQMIRRMYKPHIIKIGAFLYFTNDYAEKLLNKYKIPEYKHINTSECAKLLGCSNGWVNKLIYNGKLEAVKSGGRWKVYEHSELIRNARMRNGRK